MEISFFGYYLIIINVIGFLLFALIVYLYTYTPEGQVDALLTICSLLGGSLGIIISILIFDRKALKENMMSRVFVICIFIIQLVLFLFFKGDHDSGITIKFWKFFDQHRMIIYYLVIINFITLVAFGVDKINSMQNRSRIRIITLLGLALFGGSIGALAGIYAFKHKTNKDYFTVGVPLIIIMQIFVIFYLMNL